MSRPMASGKRFSDALETIGCELIDPDCKYSGVRKRYVIRCKKHHWHVWSALGSNIISGHRCKLCRNEESSHSNRLSHEEVVKRLEDSGTSVRIRDGFKYIDRKTPIPMICPIHPDYNWMVRPLDAIRNKCPKCVKQAPLDNDEIDKRLSGRNIIRLSDYLGRTNSRMRFRCTVDGYEWEAQVRKVAGVSDQSGCPKCASAERWSSARVKNWLASNAPNILIVNGIKSAHCNETQFKCIATGYIWKQQFGNLRIKKQCPCCSKNKHWNSELIDLYLNSRDDKLRRVGEYKKGNKRITLKCELHDLEFSLDKGHLIRGQGCPKCSSGGGFKKLSSAYLYYAKLIVFDKIYFKIGITNRCPEVRVKETGYNFIMLDFLHFESGDEARKKELEILTRFSEKVQTSHKFSGSTECFVEDILQGKTILEFMEPPINANLPLYLQTTRKL